MADKKLKKTKDRHSFHVWVIGFVRHTIVPVLKKRHGVVKEEKLSLPDGPCVVIFNHTTDLDVVWIQDAFETQMYCIASEHIARAAFTGKLISFFFEPILLKKGMGGSSVVMEMFRHLKKGYHILMAPEGMRCGNGLTGEMVPATAAVLKRLKCNVVTVRVHGGYFTTPRWGKGVRKGRITIEKVAEYTIAQIAELSTEEFHKKICGDIAVDAYADNETARIAYKGRKLAENIELQTGLCPNCRKMNTIHSKGNEFGCECGMKGRMDEYGMISGEKLPFTTVTEWDQWVDEYLKEQAADWAGSDEIILSNGGMILTEILTGHKQKTVDRGELVLTGRLVRIGGTEIPLESLSECTVFGYGKLLLSVTDRKYYEVDGAKYPGVIYHKIITLLTKQQAKGEETP